MRSEDRKAFLEIVIGFAELKGKQLSAPALELYWNSMLDWPLEDFRAAAQLLLKTVVFMPTPKDFEDLLRAQKPTAGEAWEKILQHCKGAYRDGAGLDNDGPIDMAVRGLGGYRAIAFHDLEYMPILQRQFVERYEESRDVFESRALLPDMSQGTKLSDVVLQLNRPK